MEARAVAKYLKISPYKVRPVLNQVRNQPVEEALARLAASPRKAARLLEKVIQSAAANLKGKGKINERLIYIKKIFADEGPLVPPFKYRPRARGMANRIRNRTCHITVVVEEAEAPAPETTKALRRSRRKKKP
ncbi:MAG: 50S ribosomal protein L22 [Candidatus Euphemobacter frigidus]|nr:50S ribosomal protein L22 [Candidatus Euphemobacter frigidus]MDP8276199.1 50S ribosomal protein L22 [Candidatus Euphemobacter frigidus]